MRLSSRRNGIMGLRRPAIWLKSTLGMRRENNSPPPNSQNAEIDGDKNVTDLKSEILLVGIPSLVSFGKLVFESQVTNIESDKNRSSVAEAGAC